MGSMNSDLLHQPGASYVSGLTFEAKRQHDCESLRSQQSIVRYIQAAILELVLDVEGSTVYPGNYLPKSSLSLSTSPVSGNII
jgi:hypothetical protein